MRTRVFRRMVAVLAFTTIATALVSPAAVAAPSAGVDGQSLWARAWGWATSFLVPVTLATDAGSGGDPNGKHQVAPPAPDGKSGAHSRPGRQRAKGGLTCPTGDCLPGSGGSTRDAGSGGDPNG